MTPEQISAKVAAGYIKACSKVGSSIVFRRMVSTGGANPATNPVTGTITVSANASAGASTITLTAPVGNWFIDVGDVLSIGGTSYTVTARTTAASSKFTNVPISPVLAANVLAGAAVTVTWTNDYPCRAMVDDYSAYMIDGTTITARDLRVKVPTNDAAGRTIPEPTALDRIFIGGKSRTVGIVLPEHAGADPAWYACQAKG